MRRSLFFSLVLALLVATLPLFFPWLSFVFTLLWPRGWPP